MNVYRFVADHSVGGQPPPRGVSTDVIVAHPGSAQDAFLWLKSQGMMNWKYRGGQIIEPTIIKNDQIEIAGLPKDGEAPMETDCEDFFGQNFIQG